MNQQDEPIFTKIALTRRLSVKSFYNQFYENARNTLVVDAM